MCISGECSNHDDCAFGDSDEANARSPMSLNRRLFRPHPDCRLVPTWSNQPLYTNYSMFSSCNSIITRRFIKVSLKLFTGKGQKIVITLMLHGELVKLDFSKVI